MEIRYTVTDEKNLDIIKSLWIKLNEYHKSLTKHYIAHFHGMTFERRKKDLLKKSAGGALRIDLATDAETKELIGYCVTSINAEKHGEVESLYIEPDYRRKYIGSTMMKKVLEWLDEQAVTRKMVAVASGNEEVFDFYNRYNFYPRVTVLEQTEPD